MYVNSLFPTLKKIKVAYRYKKAIVNVRIYIQFLCERERERERDRIFISYLFLLSIDRRERLLHVVLYIFYQ